MAPGLKQKTRSLLQSTCFAAVASERYTLKKPKQSWRDSSAHKVLASCRKDLSSDSWYPVSVQKAKESGVGKGGEHLSLTLESRDGWIPGSLQAAGRDYVIEFQTSERSCLRQNVGGV